ncbi:MAG: hypothetical protein LBI20_03755 [Holosporales bacterium]|nr:hypothetical protein [Holosporales bacterium]
MLKPSRPEEVRPTRQPPADPTHKHTAKKPEIQPPASSYASTGRSEPDLEMRQRNFSATLRRKNQERQEAKAPLFRDLLHLTQDSKTSSDPEPTLPIMTKIFALISTHQLTHHDIETWLESNKATVDPEDLDLLTDAYVDTVQLLLTKAGLNCYKQDIELRNAVTEYLVLGIPIRIGLVERLKDYFRYHPYILEYILTQESVRLANIVGSPLGQVPQRALNIYQQTLLEEHPQAQELVNSIIITGTPQGIWASQQLRHIPSPAAHPGALSPIEEIAYIQTNQPDLYKQVIKEQLDSTALAQGIPRRELYLNRFVDIPVMTEEEEDMQRQKQPKTPIGWATFLNLDEKESPDSAQEEGDSDPEQGDSAPVQVADTASPRDTEPWHQANKHLKNIPLAPPHDPTKIQEIKSQISPQTPLGQAIMQNMTSGKPLKDDQILPINQLHEKAPLEFRTVVSQLADQLVYTQALDEEDEYSACYKIFLILRLHRDPWIAACLKVQPTDDDDKLGVTDPYGTTPDNAMAQQITTVRQRIEAIRSELPEQVARQERKQANEDRKARKSRPEKPW